MIYTTKKYSNRIISLRYLKPKTIVLGTTGVYKNDLQYAYEVFKIAEYIPDQVLVSMGINVLSKFIDECRTLKPSLQVFGFHTIGNNHIIVEEDAKY